jgi:amidase
MSAHMRKLSPLSLLSLLLVIVRSFPLTPIMNTRVFPHASHYLPIDNHAHVTFDAQIPPALHIQPGDLVEVETLDCFSGLVTQQNPNVELEYSQLNPVTGPIHVQGAMPGDWLAITLHDIRPKGVGVAQCCNTLGQLSHLIHQKQPHVKFFQLDKNANTVTMVEPTNTPTQRMAPISFPASPMLGVIGVAPAGNAPLSTMPAGRHGGNLDNNQNKAKSTIYIRVNHPGALLSIGDMHASQGDGEICGTGVEIGGNVLLSCMVYKPDQMYASGNHWKCEFPVTETPTHWMTYGVVMEDIPKTTTLACQEAAHLLMGQWGFTADEAFVFLSVQGNLGLCQACHPDKGTQIAKMVVPKLPVCPRPFQNIGKSE